MNFRNQRLGRHQGCRLYNNHVNWGHSRSRVIMSCMTAVHDKRNHVKFAALCCLPSLKRQKHWLPGLLRWPSKRSKNSRRQGLTKHKKVGEGGKGAVCWLGERDKTERTYGIFTRLEINYQFHRTVVTIFFRSMYNKTIITFNFCDIQNNQGLRLITPTSTLIILDITKTSRSP